MPVAATLSPTVTILSDQFEPNRTAQSVLCIEVGRERLRLYVRDARRQGCYLEDFTFPSLLTERPLIDVLPDLFREHPVLSAGQWQEVRIGVNSPSFTLVPQPLFRKEYANSYLALMRGSPLPAHEFAPVYAHADEGFVSIFNLEHPLADYFSGAYPLQTMTFIHQTGALLQATADLERHSLAPQTVYLSFEDEFVTIVSRAGGQLKYCNRFGFKNAQDLAYYVLYVLDEQKLDPQTVNVALYGEITPFADTYTELSRFLKNLQFGSTPPGVRLADAFDELPAHRYLSLYGLSLLKE